MRRTSSPGAARHRRAQRGGFFLGLIVGLLAGLAVSLGVALYVTKVPVPFINKVPQRSAGAGCRAGREEPQLGPQRPARRQGRDTPPAPAASAASTAAPATPPSAAPAAAGQARRPAAASREGRQGRRPPAARSAAATADPFIYFVQAGAYARAEDAEQQRANLALMGRRGEDHRARAGRAHGVSGARRALRAQGRGRSGQGKARRGGRRLGAGAGTALSNRRREAPMQLRSEAGLMPRPPCKIAQGRRFDSNLCGSKALHPRVIQRKHE